ncbi:hypothetical protein KHA93_00510 [Bacillus sp. FJAT-49732]|uniref:Uncharacterized protein n=1 Tax=Lederbergia citrisecunda TaxID=2833583 RepID=A0A942YK17_9BACI|nr:hypothetical protein [Lederbergia citrisecunda]MBS4198140.1 hypothetical protein [Lederbergia citrisecunda]
MYKAYSSVKSITLYIAVLSNIAAFYRITILIFSVEEDFIWMVWLAVLIIIGNKSFIKKKYGLN